ncbi:MAG: RNB domain-containing ribonuclease [Myxococcaceae bacterium]|jgi:ribonuclease R|nr:RNB domain-containing ribonuclease [Myxococcaceae bacterium]MCA3011155.1 RNB domain-containing ribonuclease [Myxococcaceae bacterium]
MSARHALDGVVTALQLRTDFPPEVMAEARALLAAPGVDDPALVDRTDLPFVTIDSATSRDLDQAVHVTAQGDGHLVAYAIADASFYVRPGSALFAEALRRGASYYFPGFSVPMLPRELCEHLVSLNPDGPRRALLFWHVLDGAGDVVSTRLERARVRSRAKLSFGDVQRLIDAPTTSPLSGRDFEDSLRQLKTVGQRRLKLAAERGLVRYRREEASVTLDGEGLAFSVMEVVRDEVELWNEQVSLLCNAEGGRVLRESNHPAVQPIYRVQGGPDPARLEALARLTAHLCELEELPAHPWRWDGATPLSDYLRGLPSGPAGSRDDRLARALTRQALLVNLRSEYSTSPGQHVGVGAEPYARFSAPMRELVGVYLHKEAVELLTGECPPAEEDERLRAEVVQVANRARQTQRKVQDLSNEVVLDRLFAPELAAPRAGRTVFTGTVLGLSGSKVHVKLDAPPIDLKLLLFDLAPFFGGAWLEVAREGACLVARGTTAPLLRLGQPLRLRVLRRDERSRRWVFEPLGALAA